MLLLIKPFVYQILSEQFLNPTALSFFQCKVLKFCACACFGFQNNGYWLLLDFTATVNKCRVMAVNVCSYFVQERIII